MALVEPSAQRRKTNLRGRSHCSSTKLRPMLQYVKTSLSALLHNVKEKLNPIKVTYSLLEALFSLEEARSVLCIQLIR